MHQNRLKGVRSQAQKDTLAEAQPWQEAELSGLLGVSEELETNTAESCQQIRGPDGEGQDASGIMQSHQHRNADSGERKARGNTGDRKSKI